MSGRRRLWTIAALVAVTVTSAGAPARGSDEPVGDLPTAAPTAQRVVMFTDSVGLGARTALPRAFPAGWEVNVDGQPARFVEQLEANFVRPRLASNPSWFGDHVVIAAGYNYPYWDPARFDRSIDSMIATLTAAGVRHVHWVMLREVEPQYVSAAAWRQIQPYYWYFPRVNAHLEAALERHPDLSLVDWRAAARRSDVTYDAIHLNTTGAALYSALIRDSVTAAATRVADGSTTVVRVPGAAGAAAGAINLTTTEPRKVGFLAAHPCGGPVPNVSLHNHRRGEIAAHSGIVPLSPDGTFCVTSRSATNLVVDVTGLFPRDGGFVAVTPTRWLDTRLAGTPVGAGETIALDLDDVRASGLPNAPAAVAVVATATEATEAGWLRVATCGTPGTTSNVNYLDGFAVPNLVVVEPDADGRICVTSLSSTHVIVDLFGAFEADAEIAAANARRIFDSRETGTRVAAGREVRLDLAAVGVDAAEGAVLNLTALHAAAPGFLSAYPCADGRPEASNLNVLPGQVVANAAIVAPDDDLMVCVFSLTEADLVVDLMGTIGRPVQGIAPIRALDTRR